MKTHILYFTIAALLLSSCSSTNKILVRNDAYKSKTTLKLNQTLKGYSDERKKRVIRIPDYHLTFKHYYSENDLNEAEYNLDIKLSTIVRAYEVEPALYINADNNIMKLEADKQVTKMYQQGSSSTSSETSTSTSEDPDNEGEEKTETTTTYTTTSSHDTFQLMQLRFSPDMETMKKIASSNKVSFRVYIDNEMIDVPFKGRWQRKLRKYVERI